jgi:uncharacterized protein
VKVRDAAVAKPPREAGPAEARIFRAAVAICAIAALDDAFVHREPGTSAGDHLASGLVPAGVALVLALFYPRVRAGLRAAVALVCGVLGLTAGVADGFRHVWIDRIAGDDITAMLAGLSGVALVVLGVSTLWQTRRLDERPRRRYLRRALVAAVAAVAGVFVVLPVAFAIVATHRARAPVDAVDLGRPYELVGFNTRDGIRLAGWYVPSRNRAAVIVSPGRDDLTRHARMLAGHGYGVLLFDRRGESESEGDFNAFGWGGDDDIKAGVSFLRRRADIDPTRIGGLGLSVGGEMMIEAAAEDRRLRAVVSEGAGARSLAEHWDLPGAAGVQKPFSAWLAQTAALTVVANQLPPPSLTSLIDEVAPRPLLLIRGLDGQAQEALNSVLYDEAGPPKALWEVPDAGHTAALSAQPGQYERRVVGFFDRALLNNP